MAMMKKTDAAGIVDRLENEYRTSVTALRTSLKSFLAGGPPPDPVARRAGAYVYPELRLVINEGVNGRFARPTPESLARQLVTMIRKLEDPAYAARAHARSREMASWWTIAHQSEAIIDLYRDLAAGRPVTESMHAIPPTEDA